MHDHDLLNFAYIEVDKTLSRLFKFRKEMSEIIERLDGDIAQLKTLLIAIESSPVLTDDREEDSHE
jgi:hypothetical protein